MASPRDGLWEIAKNEATEPMASPDRRIGWDQYSTGKLVPSLRQKTSSLEWASLPDRNALTMAHSRIGNGVPSACEYWDNKWGFRPRTWPRAENPKMRKYA